jgi:hypothetical protein
MAQVLDMRVIFVHIYTIQRSAPVPLILLKYDFLCVCLFHDGYRTRHLTD